MTTPFPEPSTATPSPAFGGVDAPTPHHRRPRLGVVALVPSPAGAATTLTIRGAGFGHGVGHEPVRRDGLREARRRLRRHPARTTTRARRSATVSSYDVRVLLADAARSLFRGRPGPHAQLLDPARPTRSSRAARGSCVKQRAPQAGDLAGAAGAAPAQVGGSVLLGGSRYRGSLEFRRSGSGLMAVNALGLEDYVRGRRARARSPVVVAGRGAEGAGRRRAHLRDHDGQARRGLRPVRRHALAGVRRRRRRDAGDRPGRRGDRAARS